MNEIQVRTGSQVKCSFFVYVRLMSWMNQPTNSLHAGDLVVGAIARLTEMEFTS